jgi:hypothetical protein
VRAGSSTWSLLAGALAALALAGGGCVDDGAADPASWTSSFPARSTDELISVDLREVADPEAEADAAGVCACADEACVREWVAESFGCDVCAAFVCPDTALHACVRCDGD